MDAERQAEIVQRARAAGQGHVLRFWDLLSTRERRGLLSQLARIDFSLLEWLRKDDRSWGKQPRGGELVPPRARKLPRTEGEREEWAEAGVLGEEALRAGKVAALVVAGGQGTRLGYAGPKGTFSVGLPSGSSLFRIQGERILAARRRYGAPIPWYIMTSEPNDAETREFFRQHDHFGLPSGDIYFFTQGMVPTVDRQGRLILSGKASIAVNPNGHGGTLEALEASGALADMRQRGIEVISFYQVDNILIRILDPVFIGFHLSQKAEISLKVVRKRNPEEKVGIVARQDEKLTVVEYFDLEEKDKLARSADGEFKYWAGSIAIHLFARQFVEGLTAPGADSLPFHRAEKVVPTVDDEGNPFHPQKKNGIKFEMFVFDALPFAREAVVLEVERREEFAPVKDAKGEDSPDSAREALLELHARWLEAAGVTVPRNADGALRYPVEVSPLFALDEQELGEKISPGLRIEGPLFLQ